MMKSAYEVAGVTKLTPRQQEVIASMTPGEWYKPSDLKTSQKFMQDLLALKLVRRKNARGTIPEGKGLGYARLDSAYYCLNLKTRI